MTLSAYLVPFDISIVIPFSPGADVDVDVKHQQPYHASVTGEC